MLLLSALSAKDFAVDIVVFLCGLLEEGGPFGCCLRIDGSSTKGTGCLRMPTFVIEH